MAPSTRDVITGPKVQNGHPYFYTYRQRCMCSVDNEFPFEEMQQLVWLLAFWHNRQWLQDEEKAFKYAHMHICIQ